MRDVFFVCELASLASRALFLSPASRLPNHLSFPRHPSGLSPPWYVVVSTRTSPGLN